MNYIYIYKELGLPNIIFRLLISKGGNIMPLHMVTDSLDSLPSWLTALVF